VILVTTGTNGDPFDRLLEAVRDLVLDEELVIQHGPSAIRVERATNLSYVSFTELEALVQRARLVITHAGVGSILLAFMHSRRPLVVPRLERHGEAVDDHQLVLATRLAELGLISLVEDVSNLARTIESVDPALAAGHVPGAAALATDVRRFVDELCDGGTRSARRGLQRKQTTS
jgi:UDP-N-acetylglucosamine transferase subunit ALG13